MMSIKRYFFQQIFLLLYFGIFLSWPSVAQNSYNRPNIIIIMADDLGYGDLGCYGQEKILTPNIDKLAAEGMIFTQAYAGSSVCAPSRCSLMTGFHNGHNRIRDNVPHGTYLRPDDFTIAELLKQAGYKTAGVGKWGLGIPGSWGLPNQQGFDNWYGHYNQDQAHFYYPDFLWENDHLVLLQKMEMINDVGVVVGNRGGKNALYTHDIFTEKALELIDEKADQPFFLYLPYTIPHFSDYPKDSPDIYIVPSDEPYTKKDWLQVAKNYAAMITRMDKDVGKILHLIKEKGLEENTMIIFTSDNGPYGEIPTPIEFFNSNGPLRGGKRENYEGGIRVPFVVRWKNMIPEGTKNDKPIAFWDVMPTLADIIDYPGDLKTDGLSFLPDLLGEKGSEHDYLYWDYGHTRSIFTQALRMGKYKLVCFVQEDKIQYELYDLENDVAETNDLSARLPEVMNQLKEKMNEAYLYSDAYPRKVSHQ